MAGKKRRVYSNSDNNNTNNSSVNKQRKVLHENDVTTVYAPVDMRSDSIQKNGLSGIFLLLLCFLVPFIIMGVCFYLSNVFPFGDRSVLYSDLKAQYFPFLEELQRKLRDGGSLLYSWNTGMGSNFLSMIGYYIASPLNFLLVFVPTEWMLPALAVLIMTKISSASLFCGIFLKKVFKRSDLSLVAFGCCYAFCGFMMGYYWNIIWLDSVALLPLVALGVYKLVYEKKFILYTLSLAVAMIANYYIGYMLCLFTAMWFFILWLKHPKCNDIKPRFTKSLLSIIGYSAIALALSAFLIVPSYIQLGNTVAANDILTKPFDGYHSIFEILGNTLGFHNPVTMQGLPNTYCGIICLLLIFVFIRSPRISLVEKTVDICFVVFLLLSLNMKLLDYLWHGLHFPNQIPHRFAFIFAFFLIILAYRAFTQLKYLCTADILAMSIGALVFVLLGAISTASTDKFATMDGKAVLLSAAAFLIYIFVMLLKERNILSDNVFTVIISVLIIAEMTSSCFIGVKTVGTSDMNYPDKVEQVQTLVDYAENMNTDSDFYRIEQTNISSKNDGMYYDYRGVSQFSSTSDENMLKFMRKLGITAKRSSWHYMMSSPLTNSFFNLKYLIDRTDYTSGDTTITKCTDTDSVVLYSNNYYLPLGFMANSELGKLNIYSSDYGDSYENFVFNVQNAIFRSSTGLSEDIFIEISPNGTNIDNGNLSAGQEKMGNYNYSDANSGSVVEISYTVPKDGMVYAYANFQNDSKKITVSSGEISRDIDIDARRYVFPAGEFKKGDVIKFSSTLTETSGSGDVKLYVSTFNQELYEQGYDLLKDETMTVTNYTDTVVEGTVSAKENGLLYTSIPNEKKGWTAYVDGKEAEIVPVFGAFVGLNIEAGDHTISFEYTPDGFGIGLIITAVAAVAFIVLCVIAFIKYRKSKALINSDTTTN